MAKYSPEAKKLVMMSEHIPKFYNGDQIIENVTSSCAASEMCPSCGDRTASVRSGVELSPDGTTYIPVAILVVVCLVAFILVLVVVLVAVFVVRQHSRGMLR